MPPSDVGGVLHAPRHSATAASCGSSRRRRRTVSSTGTGAALFPQLIACLARIAHRASLSLRARVPITRQMAAPRAESDGPPRSLSGSAAEASTPLGLRSCHSCFRGDEGGDGPSGEASVRVRSRADAFASRCRVVVASGSQPLSHLTSSDGTGSRAAKAPVAVALRMGGRREIRRQSTSRLTDDIRKRPVCTREPPRAPSIVSGPERARRNSRLNSECGWLS